MDLRDSLNQYYYNMTVAGLRHLSRSGGGDLSYNSIMYLDVISYQQVQGCCTVSTLAETLRITRSAVTLKVNDLEKQGLVVKVRSETDRRVINLRLSDAASQMLADLDRPFERAVRHTAAAYSAKEIELFCNILQTFYQEFMEES